MYPTDLPVLPDEAFTDLCINHDVYGYATAKTPAIFEFIGKTVNFLKIPFRLKFHVRQWLLEPLTNMNNHKSLMGVF